MKFFGWMGVAQGPVDNILVVDPFKDQHPGFLNRIQKFLSHVADVSVWRVSSFF